MKNFPKLGQVVCGITGNLLGVVDQTRSSGEVVVESSEGSRTTYKLDDVELDCNPEHVIHATLQYRKQNIFYPNPVIRTIHFPEIKIDGCWSLRTVETRLKENK